MRTLCCTTVALFLSFAFNTCATPVVLPGTTSRSIIPSGSTFRSSSSINSTLSSALSTRLSSSVESTLSSLSSSIQLSSSAGSAISSPSLIQSSGSVGSTQSSPLLIRPSGPVGSTQSSPSLKRPSSSANSTLSAASSIQISSYASSARRASAAASSVQSSSSDLSSRKPFPTAGFPSGILSSSPPISSSGAPFPSAAANASTVISSSTPPSLSPTLSRSAISAGISYGTKGISGKTGPTVGNSALSLSESSAVVNLTLSNSIIPTSLLLSSLYPISGSNTASRPLITPFPITSNASRVTTNASISTQQCVDWLDKPIPCSCQGAYHSFYTPTTYTTIYINTKSQQTTETITTTLQPAAIAPDGDCGLGCYIGANEVQIIYWPVATGAPNQTNLSITAAAPTAPYTVVSDNFTFTSPSVYVAYRGLQASAAYLPFGQNMGGGTHDVTVGYPPEALSTSHCNLDYAASAVQYYKPVNYTELQYPPPNSELTDCPHAGGGPILGGATYNPSGTDEAENPFFTVPGNLAWVDPAWSQCIPVSYGLYDPPRKLNKESAIVAPTPAASPVSALADASPAASITQPLPTATSTAASDPNTPVSQPSQNPINNPAVNTAVAQNQGANDPNAVTPGSSPDPTSVNPDNENAAQMSALRQALAPTPAASPQPGSQAPAAQPAAQPASQPGNTAADPKVNSAPSSNSGTIQENSDSTPAQGDTGSSQGSANVNPAQSIAESGSNSGQQTPASGQGTPQANANSNPVVMATPSSVVIAGNTVAPAPNGGAVIASSTYTPGSKATLSGQVYSVGSSIIQDANSQTYSIQPTPTPVLVAGNSIANAAGGGVVIASSTYAPGTEAQISGTTFSVGPDNIAVAGTTHALPASPSQTPVLVGGQSVARASNGGLVVGSSTIAPGEQATISNQVVSAGPSNAIVDGSTYALPTATGAVLQQAAAQQAALAEQQTPVLVGGQSIVKASNGGVVIGGTSTLAPGAQATVAGQVISAGPSNVIVDGSSYSLPQTPGAVVQQAPEQSPAPVLVGGQSIVKASNGGVIIGGTSTLAPGAQATVAGQVISAGPSNVVVDGSSYSLPQTAGAVVQQAPTQSQAPVLVGGQTIARAPNGGIVIGSSTLAPGSVTTVGGQTISAAPDNGNVVLDGSTIALAASAGAVLQTAAAQSQQQSPVLVGGQTVSRAPNGGIIIGSSTLAPGSVTTIAGQTISAAPSNGNVVLDGSTIALATSAGAVLQTPSPQQQQQQESPVLINGQTITRAPNGAIMLGSTTLAPGSQTTIAGQTISAAPAGSNSVVVDGSTIPLAPTPFAVLQTPSPQPQQTQTPVLIGGQTVSRAPNGALIIGSSTLPPGATATIAGHTITAGSSSNGNIILDGTNYYLPPTPGAVLSAFPSPTSTPTLTLIPIPATTPPQPPGEPVVTFANGALLSAGGPAATISGLLASVLPSDAGILIGGTTYPFPSPSPTANSIFTMPNGQVFTAAPTGFVIAAGETVVPGGAGVTLAGGTVVSLDRGGDLVVGSRTVALGAAGATATAMDGGFVVGVVWPSGSVGGGSSGGSGGGVNESSPTKAYTAGSARHVTSSMELWISGMLGWGIGMIALGL